MALIVIEHPALDGARSVVDADSLDCWADVGWVLVGPVDGDPTDAERAASVPREQDAAPQPLEGE
jgi:hypothetical protein